MTRSLTSYVFVICLLIFFCGCNRAKSKITLREGAYEYKQIDSLYSVVVEKKANPADTVSLFIDLLGKYTDFKSQAVDAEIKYYRTTKEKYRLQANRLYDSSAKYGKILGRLQKQMRQ